MRRIILILAVSLVACGNCLGADGDWRIVPGVGIGHVKIGMDRLDVLKILGTPYHEEDLWVTQNIGHIFRPNVGLIDLPVLDGVIRDDWITPLPVGKSEARGHFMCDFLTVYYKDRRVVQVEEQAGRFKTRNGLSIASTAVDFEKEFPQYTGTPCKFHHTSSGGWPATKHFVDFEDAVKAGIAWRYGGFGNLAPDPDPADVLEAIEVHSAGVPMLMDPDGGSRFIWKDSPYRRSGE